MAYSDRELAEKLVKIPDAEIEQYHKQRVKEARKFYYYGALCGAAVILFYVINIVWLSIVLGVLGLAFVQTGRYKREKWKRTYHFLMYQRGSQIQKDKDFAEATKYEGSKYKNAKNKLRNSESNKNAEN